MTDDPAPAPGTAADDAEPATAARAAALLGDVTDPTFDRMTDMVARLVRAPVALITLVDAEGSCFLGATGLPKREPGYRLAAPPSFCRTLVESGEPLAIADAREHPVLHASPSVRDLGAVAYLGVPLRLASGRVVGSLCAIDRVRREWTAAELGLLQDLATFTVSEIQHRELEHESRAVHRASEDRYRTLFEHNPLPMWVYDRETLRFLAVNDAAVRHYGFSREQFLGMTIRDIHPADDIPQLEQVLAQIEARRAEEGVPQRWYSGGIHHLNAAGEVIDVEVSSHELVFGGRAARLMLAHDVTARRRTEQAQLAVYRVSEAAQAAQTLEELFRAIHRMVSDLMPARNFYIALYDAVTDTVSFPYFVDEHERRPSPRRGGRGLTEYVLRTGEPLLDRANRYQPLAAQGLVEPIGPESTDWLGVPLKAHGQTIGVLVAQTYDPRERYGDRERELLQFVSSQIAMAIERKRAEEALEAANDYLQTLIEASPLAIFVLGSGGEVRTWNPAAERLFGWSAAEVVGRPSPLGAMKAVGDSLSVGERVLRGESVTGVEVLRPRRDGRPLVLSVSAAPMTDGSGRVTGILKVVADMTAVRHLEGQVRQSQKMEAIGQLAGGIAHDFNNLLTAVLNNAELAQRQLEPSEGPHAELAQIVEAGRRAASLTRQLLTFSRRQVLQPRPVDLNQVVGQLEELLRRVISEDIRLDVVLASSPCVVLADPSQLEQVVMNLVVNARDAMPGGGILSIETSVGTGAPARRGAAAAGRHVTLTVRDTGIGMDSATQARIFEPFFTTKPVGQGTGLGLATVYGIVEQSEGNITVTSAPGRGTTFTVHLPGHVTDAPGGEPSPLGPPALSRGSERLLLVEDDPGVRTTLERLLVRQGYWVVSARNGAEALERFEECGGTIDAVLTDIVMPELSGRELVARLRERDPELRVLFMSGYDEKALRPGGALPPGARAIVKPFTIADLLSSLRAVLDLPGTRNAASIPLGG